ncbi:SRPBCC domain-containing protein [Microbacterium trichothecenolyticum]|uniref:SRPBCC domain-containing protein n=1 Tax=Microbacterium trichothecenolyticum TaxID=69370 RepID=UPI001C6F17E1|nr:SRPBCC domain-containing protein [Microbacterium trichothecenolyticum]MBW9122455.1 SRPBCC domain-containing protein [Microbacterium trichothecenolyticum]
MRVDSASRLIAAAPERVFAAFTDAEQLLAWLPPSGMSGRFDRFDPVAGYRMVLTYDEAPEGGGKASADADVAEVRRVELAPPHRIVEAIDFPSDDPAFAGTMTMTWSFEPRRSGTLVTVEATDVPAGISPEDHAEGLASSLANLARLIE